MAGTNVSRTNKIVYVLVLITCMTGALIHVQTARSQVLAAGAPARTAIFKNVIDLADLTPLRLLDYCARDGQLFALVGKPQQQYELLQIDSSGTLIRRQILPDLTGSHSVIRANALGKVVITGADDRSYASELWQYTTNGAPAGHIDQVSDYLIDLAPWGDDWIAVGYKGLHRVDFAGSSTKIINENQFRYPTFLFPAGSNEFELINLQDGLISHVWVGAVTKVGPAQTPNVPELAERSPEMIEEGIAAFFYGPAGDEHGSFYVTLPNMTARPYFRILAFPPQGAAYRLLVTLPPASPPDQRRALPHKLTVTGSHLFGRSL